MVYSSKCVFCVLVDGVPQKELANGQVNIPFGEYALRFRNKNDRRAVVKIYIDGENVGGPGYIIPANDFIDIKRHHDKDCAFKLVALDHPAAIDAGKNGPNEDKQKGVIEARFYLEKAQPVRPMEIHHHHHHDYYPPVIHHDHHHYRERKVYPCSTGIWMNDCSSNDSGVYGATLGSNDAIKCSTSFNPEICYRSSGISGQSVRGDIKTKTCSVPPTLHDGCTVEGARTGQSFYTRSIDLEEDYTSLKLFLQGYYKNEEVQIASVEKHETVKTKQLRELEEENRRLREEIEKAKAERDLAGENERLKQELSQLK